MDHKRKLFMKKMADSVEFRQKNMSVSQSRVALQPADSMTESVHETRHNQIWERIPKTKEDWMNIMVAMIRRKANLGHMSDKDIEHTVKRARPLLFSTKPAKIDPDLPDCFYWNETRVEQWIESLGFPDVKKMFVANNISGKKLILVDVCSLNQMGLKDLKRAMEVTNHIRTILKIPAPNALRAVMRLVPLELYYRKKFKTGIKTDLLTFKTFCRTNGLPYHVVKLNKCATVIPECVVEITQSRKPDKTGGVQASQNEIMNSDDEQSVASEDSLKYSPTVEIIVRSHPIRERVITSVLDRIIQLVVEEVAIRQTEREAQAAAAEAEVERRKLHPLEYRVRDIFSKAYTELGIDVSELSQERVEFVASVADQLMKDILKTQEIIEDMETFEGYMENSMDSETMMMARDIAHEVLEDVSPIAALLALGQLELGALIKEAPGLQDFVTDIVNKAENEATIQADAEEAAQKRSKGGKGSSRNRRRTHGSYPVKDALSETKQRLINKVRRSYLRSKERPVTFEENTNTDIDDFENLEYMLHSSGSATSA